MCIVTKLIFRIRQNLLTFVTFGDSLLILVVVKDDRRILLLNLGRQSVLVVVPEEMQQIFELDVLGIVINLNDFGVIAAEILIRMRNCFQ